MPPFSTTPAHTRCENLIVTASQHVWKPIKSSWQYKKICASLATQYKCLWRRPGILLFAACAPSNLDPASSKMHYKICTWGNMNFTLPVRPLNSLNIPKQPPASKSAQPGPPWPTCVKDKYNPSRAATSRAACSRQDFCRKVTEVRGGRVSAVPIIERGCERGRRVRAVADGSPHTPSFVTLSDLHHRVRTVSDQSIQ